MTLLFGSIDERHQEHHRVYETHVLRRGDDRFEFLLISKMLLQLVSYGGDDRVENAAHRFEYPFRSITGRFIGDEGTKQFSLRLDERVRFSLPRIIAERCR